MITAPSLYAATIRFADLFHVVMPKNEIYDMIYTSYKLSESRQHGNQMEYFFELDPTGAGIDMSTFDEFDKLPSQRDEEKIKRETAAVVDPDEPMIPPLLDTENENNTLFAIEDTIVCGANKP